MAISKETELALLDATALIVSGYIDANKVKEERIPAVIDGVFAALRAKVQEESPAPEGAPRRGRPRAVRGAASGVAPVASIEESIQPDYLVCLEDGKKCKMLKRYLKTHFGLTERAYKAKWGLPNDYPMIAPNYAEKRSALAKKNGFGRKKS